MSMLTFQETIAKYQIEAAKLTKSEPAKWLLRVNGKLVTDDLVHVKEAVVANGFDLGHFSFLNGSGGAAWKMYEMPHCCGIIISCHAHINKDMRGLGLGRLMNSFRQDIARLLDYSLFFCTDIEANLPQRRLLKSAGFKDIYGFVNKRTGNLVHLSVIDL